MSFRISILSILISFLICLGTGITQGIHIAYAEEADYDATGGMVISGEGNTGVESTSGQSGSTNDTPSGGDVSPAGGNQGGGNQLSNSSFKITNPLKNTSSIPELLLKILDVLLVFAIPFIVFYIMYAGYNFVMAQGNPGQVSAARAALLWAVVGGVIILGAKVIVEIIQNTITAF